MDPMEWEFIIWLYKSNEVESQKLSRKNDCWLTER